MVYAALTLPLMPVQALAVTLGWRRIAEGLPVVYHRLCHRILGFQVEVRGTRSATRPTLFIANHASYFDIIILAGLHPLSFVAKAEVARWPFFGWLAKLQRTVFIDRRTRSTANNRDEMQRRIEAGDNLVLFAEGTSNDGNRVLPFKTALLSVAERTVDGQPLTVQPVSIAYVRLNGMPIGYSLRPLFAWYGDMELGPHLWEALGMGRVEVVVEFHPVVDASVCGNRRRLALACHGAIARGVDQALRGLHKA
jgi:1-acyl-sn-glycerol-3-phosphate acyltransferase